MERQDRRPFGTERAPESALSCECRTPRSRAQAASVSVKRQRSAARPGALRSVSSWLLSGRRPGCVIGMQIDAVRPFRDEAIIFMADQNFRSVTLNAIVFRQLYGGTQRLRLAWESCSDTAMRVLDFPSAIVVDHDISRFMQLFLQPLSTFVHPRSSEDNARARLQFVRFRAIFCGRPPTAGNGSDASACQCVGAAVRNRQNQPRPSSPLWPVDTRRHLITRQPTAGFQRLALHEGFMPARGARNRLTTRIGKRLMRVATAPTRAQQRDKQTATSERTS